MKKEQAGEALDKVKLLHRVVTENYLDLDNLLEAYLSIGKDLFGLEIGIASHVVSDSYTVVAVGRNPFGIKQNDQFELKDTYCLEVFKDKKTISVNGAGSVEPFKSHPIYENLKLESYISSPIYVEGEIYGTLNFSSVNLRPTPFNEFDKDLIELMAKSIGSFLEMKAVRLAADKHKEQAHLCSRMASLGQVSSGIAHEINTPLSIISMLNVKIKGLLEESPLNIVKIQESLDKVGATVQRINKIVVGMQLISRDVKSDIVQMENIAEVIKNSTTICRQKIKANEIDIAQEGLFDIEIPCRAGEIAQVILNLISNSIDAVETLDEKWIRIDMIDGDDFVQVSVIDSGKGISEDNVDHIMEPFYTTKAVGKGTGLGLSISQKIIELHGGKLKVDSDSKNTKFDIFLNK